MKQSRKNIIQEEINIDPNNPFNFYLLALEHQKEGDWEGAKEVYENLLINFSSYLPTYQTYVNFLLEKSVDTDKTQKLLEIGIKIAIQQNNKKAQSELQAIYDIYF